MTKKTIIIIGGGIAGLSAGCYGQMNGFRTRIFEMHKKKPGGLCTAWTRKGYTVNGCLHWLIGSGPGSRFHTIWQELGALVGKTVVDYEEYGRIEFVDGKRVIFATNLDRLEKDLHEIAPDDDAVIREFIAAARKCTRFEPPLDKAPEVMGLFDVIKMIATNLPLLWMLWKWNRVSLREFGNRFKSRHLREAFPMLFMPDFPVSFMLMTFAWLHNRSAGYLLGGSLPFSRSIETRYRSLGGEMVYQAKVDKVLTENERAVGIRLADGTEYFADYVISAADGHATIFDLLEGQYIDDTVREYYERLIPFPPLIYIALGVNRSFKDLPVATGYAFELQEPIIVGGVEHRYLDLHVYNFDPTLAPEGKTLLTSMFHTDYDFWCRLRKDEAAYRLEKDRIADQVVAILDRKFPGLASQVEMRDVSSPTTFERYTGNWKGSFEGWQVTPKTWSLGQVMRKTLPGLTHFYMAGQWVEPGGGLPAVAMSGRNVVQIICKKEELKFTSTVL